MPGKLNTNVHAVHRDEHGNVLVDRTFGPDDDLPEWAVRAITNPAVWDGPRPVLPDPEPPAPPQPSNVGTSQPPVPIPAPIPAPSSDADQGDGGQPPEPPREGPKASRAAWVTYAELIGIEVPKDASRDDVIAAVDATKAAK